MDDGERADGGAVGGTTCVILILTIRVLSAEQDSRRNGPVLIRLLPPPGSAHGLPAAGRMAKLASLWRPVPISTSDGPWNSDSKTGSNSNLKLAPSSKSVQGGLSEFRCCLPGQLREVLAHLHDHHTLWLTVTRAAGPTSHVAVRVAEVLGDMPTKMVEGCQEIIRCAEFDDVDEAVGGATVSGKVEVALKALTTRPREIAKLSMRPSSDVCFRLRLRATSSTLALLARAHKAGFLQVSLAGIRRPLSKLVETTLVLVDSWPEVQAALYEADAHIVDERLGTRIPLDLSALIQSGQRGRARVSTPRLPRLGESLSFEATISALPSVPAGSLAETLQQPDVDDDDGSDDLPHSWGLSIELQSVKLSAKAGRIYAAYEHPPLLQKRPFKSGSVVAPANITTQLPKAFASYVLSARREELLELLDKPLVLEVWKEDRFSDDELLGTATADLSSIPDAPLQKSVRMPSMISGFRVLDQMISVVAVRKNSLVGLLRVVCYLEDLGTTGPEGLKSGKAFSDPFGPSPSASAALDAVRAKAEHEQFAEPYARARQQQQHQQQQQQHQQMQMQTQGPHISDHSGPFQSGPHSKAVLDLELWKQAELDKFSLLLREEERQLKDYFEEQYREAELARTQEFRKTQGELRELEKRLQRRVSDLQERETALKASERKFAAEQAALEKGLERRLKNVEFAAEKEAALAEQELARQHERGSLLEGEVEELQKSVLSAKQEAAELEESLSRMKQQLRSENLQDASLLRDRILQLEGDIREEKSKAELLAASREHYRREAELLCDKLAAASAAPAPRTVRAEAASGRRPAALTRGSSSSQMLGNVARAPKAIANEFEVQATETVSAAEIREAVVGLKGEISQLEYLVAEREDLMQSGLYSDSDAVIAALDAKIAATLETRV